MKNNNLHNIQSTGFKTPDNYFGSLEDAVFSQLKEQAIDSKIDSSGFQVPTDYFESLDDHILGKFNDKVATKVMPLVSWKKVAYLSGIAASVILAVTLFFTNANPLSFDDLETASIESYLIDEDLNAYDLAPFLGTVELNSDEFIQNSLNASDIEDYLLQNSDVEHLIFD